MTKKEKRKGELSGLLVKLKVFQSTTDVGLLGSKILRTHFNTTLADVIQATENELYMIDTWYYFQVLEFLKTEDYHFSLSTPIEKLERLAIELGWEK